MAIRWRIRHKLTLVFCLMVALMVLLLGGTLRGFWSYYLTMNSIRGNLGELKVAEELKTALVQVGPAENLPRILDEPEKLLKKIQTVRQKIQDYEALCKDSRENPVKGEENEPELQTLKAMLSELDLFLKETEKYHEPKVLGPSGKAGPDPILESLAGLLAKMESGASGLQRRVLIGLDSTLNESRRLYQVGLWMMVPSSAIGLLLMAGFLRYFHGWIFNPIGALEAGVGRVAQGDFNHRIEVKSGDEMEALGAAFNDMTRRLRDLYADLARQVNERSRQLVRSERLASVGFLAAGVAHEINNPLAGIAFCSEALESRLEELREVASETTGIQSHPCLEDFSKYLRLIQEEASRCKNITEKLLDFSRTGEKKREPINLANIVHAVLDVTRHLQNSRGKTIKLEQEIGVTAWINAEEIRSVVLNLVVNALDSMDEGGTLEIRMRHGDGQAELRFADSGCGMSQEVLENIFEPFFTRNRIGKGTGLGLTISHRIIQQHGGEIEAASEGVNQGSVFTVRLPLHPLQGTARAGDSQSGPGRENTLALSA